MIFMLDASLPPRLARGLHELVTPGDEVRHVRDVLPDGFESHAAVAEYLEGTPACFIAMEPALDGNPHRLRAWKEFGPCVVLLNRDWLGVPLWDQAWMLTCWLEELREKGDELIPGTVFELSPEYTGKLKPKTGP